MDVGKGSSQAVIRRAAAEEASAVSRVLREAFVGYAHHYTADAYKVTTLLETQVHQRMQEGPVWIGIQRDEVVATASAVITASGCYIRGMAVVPEVRGRGFGRKLLATIEDFASESRVGRLYLSTTPFLDRAIDLYERCDFRRSATGPTELLGTPLFTMEKCLSMKLDENESQI